MDQRAKEIDDFLDEYDLKILKETWIDGEPNSLTLKQATGIWQIKRSGTFRSLTNLVLGFSCQMTGTYLSRDAARRILGLTQDELFAMEFTRENPLHVEHAHSFGTFFWWE